MFTIKYLKFYPNCEYLKNLKTGVEYSLEHKLSPNFFSENICVTAIVGKNRSGRSSQNDISKYLKKNESDGDLFRFELNHFDLCEYLLNLGNHDMQR